MTSMIFMTKHVGNKSAWTRAQANPKIVKVGGPKSAHFRRNLGCRRGRVGPGRDDSTFCTHSEELGASRPNSGFHQENIEHLELRMKSDEDRRSQMKTWTIYDIFAVLSKSMNSTENLGANQGPTWAQVGAKLGPCCPRLGANLGSTYVQLWSNLGPTWGRLGATSGSIGGRSRANSGLIRGLPQVNVGPP